MVTATTDFPRMIFILVFPPFQVNCRWKSSSKVPRAIPPLCGCYSATPVAQVNSNERGQCTENLGLCPSSFACERMPSQTPLHTLRIKPHCQMCVCVCVCPSEPVLAPLTNTSAALLRQLRSCFPVTLRFTPHILNINQKYVYMQLQSSSNRW